MRKLIFIGIVAVGALVGLLDAANDDWATRTGLATVKGTFIQERESLATGLP